MPGTVKVLCPHRDTSGCRWTETVALPSNRETLEAAIQEHLDNDHEGQGA